MSVDILRPRDEVGQESMSVVDPYTLAWELNSLISFYGDKPYKNTLINQREGWRIEGVMQGLRYALVPTEDWEGHPSVGTRSEVELRGRLQSIDKETLDSVSSLRLDEKRTGEMEALRWVLGIKPEQAEQTAAKK